MLVYIDDEGVARVHVRLVEGTVWLTQRLMAELYGKDVRTINEHLVNIYEEEELDPGATIRKFRIVRTEGNRRVSRLIDHYALPAVLAVGYRVRSTQGTRFRQWATARLEEYLVKGFILDDERLASGRGNLGVDYFEELLERVRAIRASERRFYQKITDIYAQCSADYDAKSDITQRFYATVQNKLHWAIHGHTAAELIRERADASKPNMGLTTWTRSPKGSICKTDVGIAKNYLKEDELRELERIVGMYLDYAEDQARMRRAMTMADWVAKLDGFLKFHERNVLGDAGRVSRELALEHAEGELLRYQARQQALEEERGGIRSDFDRFVARVKELGEGEG
ncbi:virulence RhuM family protein [Paraliomyxa miuraensis]|uniref:virulence RhuM family protein n=1 Tax=Paraliomyxa miuraensis TaxID=376150 RepID=UPI0022573AA8|nr:virulence RhuM family protein [Paraliomyxa miuraensis]MCX4244776.1 virulence RhuM family protein [Paraliomyxa miuraensis]